MADRNNMTKKHFITIAYIIRNAPLGDKEKAHLAEHFANFLTTQNSGFSRDRFLTACLEGLIQARHDTKARAFTASDVR